MKQDQMRTLIEEYRKGYLEPEVGNERTIERLTSGLESTIRDLNLLDVPDTLSELSLVLEGMGLSIENFPRDETSLSMSALVRIMGKFGVPPEEYEEDELVHTGDIFFYDKRYYIGSIGDDTVGRINAEKGKVLIYLLAHTNEPIRRRKLTEVSTADVLTLDSYMSEFKSRLNLSDFFELYVPHGRNSVTLRRYASNL